MSTMEPESEVRRGLRPGCGAPYNGVSMTSEKQKVALVSLLASVGLAAAKLIAALFTGSLGILSEAVHSILDAGATAITFAAVRIADRPPDETHHFGHAKVESVSALTATGLLFATTVWIVYEAAHRLLTGEAHVTVTWWAVAIIAGSIIIDYNRSKALRRVAKATTSEALDADALHFTSDMWSSIVVLLGLAAAWAGYPWADPLAALAVAGFVALAGYRLGKRTLDTLLDAAPLGTVAVIERLADETRGILDLKRLRVRPAGATLFVDADVTVRRTLPFDRVAEIQRRFIDAVRRAYPNSDVSVTVHPVVLDDETVFDKVNLIAARAGRPILHLPVQHVGDKLSVSFDLELDRGMDFTTAHDAATALEDAIGEELGEEVEVESHIEPLHIDGLSGAEVPQELRGRIEARLKSLADGVSLLTGIHDVRVRKTEHGLFVTFHCLVEGTETVEAVHDAVDTLESALKQQMPEVRRVIAHAEPPKRGG
jgi:cation diffusion facilitator family transporter